MNINLAFEKAKATPSDINEHLQILSDIARGYDVTEFGVRTGVSTLAFLHGQPKRLKSYDINPCDVSQHYRFASELGIPFDFQVGNTLEIEIEPCDILFLDTWHTAQQVAGELARHKDKVRHLLVFHDTTIFADHGENGHPGIWAPIQALIDCGDWNLLKRYTNNNGLTILARDL